MRVVFAKAPYRYPSKRAVYMQNGAFAGMGRFSSRVYVRMFHSTRDDFTRGDLQKTADNIIKPRVFYMIKIVPL